MLCDTNDHNEWDTETLNNILGREVVEIIRNDDDNDDLLLRLTFSDGSSLLFKNRYDWGCNTTLDADNTPEDLELLKQGMVVKAEVRRVSYQDDDYNPDAVFYELVSSRGGATTLVFRIENAPYYSSEVDLEFNQIKGVK